jgi:hypothetical protein
VPQSPSDRSPRLTAESHLAGARSNLDFGDYLLVGQSPEPTAVGWAITSLFYCAVHALRGYLLARHGVVVSSHEDIRTYELKYPEIKRAGAPYKHLKQQSESARSYLNPRFTWDDYSELRKDAVRVLDHWTKQIATKPRA